MKAIKSKLEYVDHYQNRIITGIDFYKIEMNKTKKVWIAKNNQALMDLTDCMDIKNICQKDLTYLDFIKYLLNKKY